MRSVMQHEFGKTPGASVPRSVFQRNNGHKTTFDVGYLIPFYLDFALPGDVAKVNCNFFLRLSSPTDYPVMDNLTATVHFFSCATRLLWPNWEKMHGAQDNPTDSIDYTVPTFTSTTAVGVNTIWDYMGVTPGVANALVGTTALPFRMYNFVWDQWYRNQAVDDSVGFDADDGPDGPSDYTLLRRRKRPDYFTSALPAPQRGDAVNLPIGDDAPLVGIGIQNQSYPSTGSYYETGNTTPQTYTNSNNSNIFVEGTAASAGYPLMYADLDNAATSTINAWRQAVQIQGLLERDARSGTRYSEQLFAHYGTTFQDVRTRPEFLGGGSFPVLFNTVTNQSGSSGNLGDLSAHGQGYGSNIGFTKAFDEHSVVLGLICVDADLTYQQGRDRHLTKSTRYDFYYPALAQIGEQAILNEELFFSGTAGTDSQTFGYTGRYNEYRHKNSRISGKFRSDAAGTLENWHLSEDFAATPVLNSSFLESDPPIDRILQVTTEPDILMDSFCFEKWARPMPLFGIPATLTRF